MDNLKHDWKLVAYDERDVLVFNGTKKDMTEQELLDWCHTQGYDRFQHEKTSK